MTTAKAASPITPLSLFLSVRSFLLQTLTSHPAVTASVGHINVVLSNIGIPEKSLLTNEEFVLTSTAGVVTLLGYYLLFGGRHGRRRRRLAEELREAQRQVSEQCLAWHGKSLSRLAIALPRFTDIPTNNQRKVHLLEEKLLLAKRQDILATTPTRPSSKQPRQIRIFMDGAFDVMHYGHMNAFRLGRSLGTYLIVGVNSDESITLCKGPPLMNDSERLTMVEGCKFVDEVLPNCPYIMTPEYLEYIFNTYEVDYVVHGDDPCIVDGKDVYAAAKKRGRYRSIPRTEGVSTTDIVGRMLLMTKDHHFLRRSRGNSVGSAVSVSGMLDAGTDEDNRRRGEDDDSDNEILNEDSGYYGRTPLGHQSKFLTTTNLLRLFSAGVKPPDEGMKVVYVDGAWDMFHCGHIEFLKEASKRGDYLIVGIHGDAAVNMRRGGNLPLMNLHERVLSVLGCKYINDVLIDAPLEITPDMIASLKISEVVHGTESDSSCIDNPADRYKYPKEMGILTQIPSPSNFKLMDIINRIQKKQQEFQQKIERKKKAEREWFENKYQTTTNGNIGNGVQK